LLLKPRGPDRLRHGTEEPAGGRLPVPLASAIAPMFTGMMLERTSFGWLLICAGALKLAYDFLLLAEFRASDADGGFDPIYPPKRFPRRDGRPPQDYGVEGTTRASMTRKTGCPPTFSSG